MKPYIYLGFVCFLAVFLSACGGQSSESVLEESEQAQTGKLEKEDSTGGGAEASAFDGRDKILKALKDNPIVLLCDCFKGFGGFFGSSTKVTGMGQSKRQAEEKALEACKQIGNKNAALPRVVNCALEPPNSGL